MQPAIIRLSKRLLLSSTTEHPDLKELWNWVNQNIESLNSRHSSKLNWGDIHIRNREDIEREATDIGEHFRSRLKNRLPNEKDLSSYEKVLKFESSKTEIADFTTESNSLMLEYSLITEKFTLIDHIADHLLLAKQDAAHQLASGEPIFGTFFINISKGYDIVEYISLKY